jgi:ribose transport system substrate-binding protein
MIMRRRPRWSGSAAVGALVAVSLVAVGCGGSDSSTSSSTSSASGKSGKKPTIGFVLPDLQNPIFVPMRTGIEDAGKKYGFTPKIVGPQSADAQGQTALIQTLTQQKVDGLVVVPVDASGVNRAIDAAVAAGIPTATANLDAPASKRAFYYGPNAKLEGQEEAKRTLATLHDQGATGALKAVLTSCLPSVTGQLDRRAGFEAGIKDNPYSSEFQLTEDGFFNTGTDPAKNLQNVQNISKSKRDAKVVYAMCAPDTENWGKVLRQDGNHDVLVAGHDWLPETMNLIEQGWLPWSLGESPYDMGFTPTKLLYEHITNGAPLPSGEKFAKSIFADKSNLEEIRKSPDVQGS